MLVMPRLWRVQFSGPCDPGYAPFATSNYHVSIDVGLAFTVSNTASKICLIHESTVWLFHSSRHSSYDQSNKVIILDSFEESPEFRVLLKVFISMGKCMTLSTIFCD